MGEHPDEAGGAEGIRSLRLAGAAAFREGRHDQALAHFAEIVRLAPEDACGYSDLALTLWALGARQVAEQGFRAALQLDPDHPAALANLGALLRELKRPAEGLPLLQRAAALRPDFAAALKNLGDLHRDMGRLDLALEPLSRACALAPEAAEAHASLGAALSDLGRFEPALAALTEAVRLAPRSAANRSQLSATLVGLGRFDEALAQIAQARALAPDDAGVCNNLGFALQRLQRPAEAAEAFRQTLARDPVFPGAGANLAMMLLLAGDYAQGWPAFEARWLSPDMALGRRPFAQPMWDGGATGRLLVHAEQGFGDTLQFCRYLPLIRSAEALIVEVQAPLVGLVRRLLEAAPLDAQVIARGEPLPAFDAHCPMMSLPWRFGTTLETIPTAPYLSADPAKAAAWRERLAETPGLKVGLVWAGGVRPNQPKLADTNRRRSLTLAGFAALGAIEGVSLVSLQKGPPAEEARTPPPGLALFDPTDELHDFADTAALIEALDLVIGVDTAVIHLAGALGKPVWMLNRFDTCWRWLLDRDDSPWYPTLRQFRQPRPGEWRTPMRSLRDALAAAAAPRAVIAA